MDKRILGLIVVAFIILYFLWPFDFIMDIIPIIGYLDDILVLIVGIIIWWRV